MNEPATYGALKRLARKSFGVQALLGLAVLVACAMFILVARRFPQPDTIRACFGLAVVAVAFWQHIPFYRALPGSFELMRTVARRSIFWWLEIARIVTVALSLPVLVVLLDRKSTRLNSSH